MCTICKHSASLCAVLTFLCLFLEHLGKSLSKDQISEFAWCLLPLAELAPSQPIHQNSLFEIVNNVFGDKPEGLIWLAVYDLKTLLQCFGRIALKSIV